MAKFSIGNVVSFQTHPFQLSTTEILISGEYLMVPPIMVITEVIDHSVLPGNDIYDKYTCLWYSTKENLFKESHFQEPDLKLLVVSDNTGIVELSVGDLVVLKTMPIELGKKRSFLQTEADTTLATSKNSITGLLSFVSPVMLVVAITQYDEKKDRSTPPGVKPKKLILSQLQNVDGLIQYQKSSQKNLSPLTLYQKYRVHPMNY